MCKVLGVSSSSYYYWLKHPVSLNELKSQELLVHINKVYQKSRCRYGSPRITIELRASGILVSRPWNCNILLERFFRQTFCCLIKVVQTGKV